MDMDSGIPYRGSRSPPRYSIGCPWAPLPDQWPASPPKRLIVGRCWAPFRIGIFHLGEGVSGEAPTMSRGMAPRKADGEAASAACAGPADGGQGGGLVFGGDGGRMGASPQPMMREVCPRRPRADENCELVRPCEDDDGELPWPSEENTGGDREELRERSYSESGGADLVKGSDRGDRC
jgi:hypothetical protein